MFPPHENCVDLRRGQNGAYLAKLLLEKGYRVVGTSRDAQVADFGNLVRVAMQGKRMPR